MMLVMVSVTIATTIIMITTMYKSMRIFTIMITCITTMTKSMMIVTRIIIISLIATITISIIIIMHIITIITTTTHFMFTRFQDCKTIGSQSFGIQHCIAVEVKMGVSVMVMMW